MIRNREGDEHQRGTIHITETNDLYLSNTYLPQFIS